MKTLKNILNSTILSSLQDYKLTNRNTNAVLYLPSNRIQQFMKMNGGKLQNYKFETPAQRKAARVEKILNCLVLSSAIFGLSLIIVNTIQTYI